MEEDQAKISRVSNITNGVGDVAGFVLSVKGLIDLAAYLKRAIGYASVGRCLR